jgi:hypothetical protein
LNWRWLPLVATIDQPSSSKSLITSPTFTSGSSLAYRMAKQSRHRSFDAAARCAALVAF